MNDAELRLFPVTVENQAALCALRVSKEQEGLVETVSDCLREAAEQPLWRPFGIYAGETPVGFAMAGFFPEEGERGRAWLDRFLIDRRFQGIGYGRAALRLLMNSILQEFVCREIYLSFVPENGRAQRLYESEGFRLTGEVDKNGEQIMVFSS